jgi:diguanylate cyclase (GGDEF)-like protein
MKHRAGAPPLAIHRAQGLGKRLTRAALESSALALLVAGLAINLMVYAWSSNALEDDAQVQARIAADASGAALLFGDIAAATETLAALRASPNIAAASLLDAQGRPFAQYRRAAGSAAAPAASGLFGDGGRTQVAAPVVQNDIPIGRVVLEVSLQPLRSRALAFAALTAVAGAFALALALLRIRRVRRAVSRTEDQLDRLAFFDPVTGLYNRHAATEHLRAMVAGARAGGGGFALVLLDLDDFKLVNDTYGHAAGDDVLRTLADRLRNGVGRADPVFRLGGDEFVVVCGDGPEGAMLDRLGGDLVECLQEPLHAARHEVYLRASVGIARYPDHAGDAEELLRAADTAMYEAKAAGKNTFAVYDRAMADETFIRLQLHTELRQAIERDQLVLHYQPIVDLGRGGVIGVEALVRWRHPERGVLAPAAFIDVAERTGLIAGIGAWVLEAAARQHAAWARCGLGRLFVAVNASGRQFRRGLLLEQVRAALACSGADPRHIQVEITEHTLVEDVAANVRTLAALRELGVQIAIDDFGTGLSSLAYLKRLPIDKLKIDRSFVRDLPAATEDAAIVAAILSMARALGLQVVAEGIETAPQRDLLQGLGADHGQGYLFSRPVPAEDIPALVAALEAAAAPAPRPCAPEGGQVFRPDPVFPSA